MFSEKQKQWNEQDICVPPNGQNHTGPKTLNYQI